MNNSIQSMWCESTYSDCDPSGEAWRKKREDDAKKKKQGEEEAKRRQDAQSGNNSQKRATTEEGVGKEEKPTNKPNAMQPTQLQR